VASSVVNDVIMRTGTASAVGARPANDVIMITAGLRRYGNWRHVATGYNTLVQEERQEDGPVVGLSHTHTQRLPGE